MPSFSQITCNSTSRGGGKLTVPLHNIACIQLLSIVQACVAFVWEKTLAEPQSFRSYLSLGNRMLSSRVDGDSFSLLHFSTVLLALGRGLVFQLTAAWSLVSGVSYAIAFSLLFKYRTSPDVGNVTVQCNLQSSISKVGVEFWWRAAHCFPSLGDVVFSF